MTQGAIRYTLMCQNQMYNTYLSLNLKNHDAILSKAIICHHRLEYLQLLNIGKKSCTQPEIEPGTFPSQGRHAATELRSLS